MNVTLWKQKRVTLVVGKVSTMAAVYLSFAEALGSKEWVRGVERPVRLQRSRLEKNGVVIALYGARTSKGYVKFSAGKAVGGAPAFCQGGLAHYKGDHERATCAYGARVARMRLQNELCLVRSRRCRSARVRRRGIECESEESLGPAWIWDGGNPRPRSDDQGYVPDGILYPRRSRFIRQVEAESEEPGELGAGTMDRCQI
jgi:hypothetical protein